MAECACIIVEYFLELFHHLRVVGGEIEALLFWLAVRIVLLSKRVLKYDVVVFTE